jgi:hypothetical protein
VRGRCACHGVVGCGDLRYLDLLSLLVEATSCSQHPFSSRVLFSVLCGVSVALYAYGLLYQLVPSWMSVHVRLLASDIHSSL